MRYPDTVADLRVPLLEISVMAYFLLNRTKHSESLRHGFSTRTHSQTRWHFNNDTARRRYFCTRAGKKLGEKVAVTTPPPSPWMSQEEDLQSSPGTQIYIALCIGSQDAQAPCRTTPSRGALVAIATPPPPPPGASIRRGGILYVWNVGRICAISTTAGEKRTVEVLRSGGRVQNTDWK